MPPFKEPPVFTELDTLLGRAKEYAESREMSLDYVELVAVATLLDTLEKHAEREKRIQQDLASLQSSIAVLENMVTREHEDNDIEYSDEEDSHDGVCLGPRDFIIRVEKHHTCDDPHCPVKREDDLRLMSSTQLREYARELLQQKDPDRPEIREALAIVNAPHTTFQVYPHGLIVRADAVSSPNLN